jgi:uncharacterized membrane protein YraQ (UPF0718 family)
MTTLNDQTTGSMTKTLRNWIIGLGVLLGINLLILSTGAAPDVVLRVFSTRFLGIFIEAAPFLLLGTLVSGLIEALVSQEMLLRFLPGNRVVATVLGGLLGLVFPVCECGVVPVARRLMSKSLPPAVAVSFLLAAPIINPIVLAGTLTAFGWGPVFVGRVLIGIGTAVGVGLIFTLADRDQVLRPVEIKALASVPVTLHTATPPRTARLYQALKVAGDEFFEMGRYLIIGSMLAAAMQTIVSQDVLLSLGRGPIASVLVMQTLAYVLSVCSTVDAFLALAFAGTFTTGSILAFLTFGPMVDIKSTLMFLSVFKRRVVAYLILLPLLITMLIAIWINLNLPI